MPQNPVISYPIPPYSNVPIQPQFYKPRNYVIVAIALGVTTTVTTAVDHDYVIGQEIRLIIPNKYGSRLLNEQLGYVVIIPAPNQIVVDIDSNGADPFIPSPVFSVFESKIVPQVLPVGGVNSGAINANGRIQNITYIPGSFINISPN